MKPYLTTTDEHRIAAAESARNHQVPPVPVISRDGGVTPTDSSADALPSVASVGVTATLQRQTITDPMASLLLSLPARWWPFETDVPFKVACRREADAARLLATALNRDYPGATELADGLSSRLALINREGVTNPHPTHNAKKFAEA